MSCRLLADPFVHSSILSPSESSADLLYASAVAAEETCEGDDDVLGLTRPLTIEPHAHAHQRQRLINSLHSRLVQQRKQQLFMPATATSSRLATHVDEPAAPAHLTDHMYEHLYEEVEIDTDVHLGPDGKPLRKRGEIATAVCATRGGSQLLSARQHCSARLQAVIIPIKA